MSGDQCFADYTVSTCVNLNVAQETPSYVEIDSALEKELSEDAEHMQKPFTQETAKLNGLRNQEHSLIYRLPLELLVEILLLAIDWFRWSVEELRVLASVSTSWRDNILSCNRFWSVMDVTATGQARRTVMKRNPEGPVDLWCMGSPSPAALRSFINDVKTIKPTRLRSVVCSHWESAFMEWLRDHKSAFIDVLMGNDDPRSLPRHVELSSEGPTLRHIDIRAVSLPWQSPRLTNLRTIHLVNLRHNAPQVNHLYAILSSSPELERLSLVNVAVPDGESPGSLPTAARPIELPVLKTLAFHVSDTIAQEITPLIRASACHTVIIDAAANLWVMLEQQEAIVQLITKPITLSTTLVLKMRDENGTFIHIRSEPDLADSWVYWAHDLPGVDVKIAIPSASVLSMLWNRLDSAFRSHGGTNPITSLDVEWAGQDFPFPFSLLKHCTALTHLRFSEDSGTALHPLIQFLGANEITERGVNLGSRFQLPNLGSLRFFATTIPNLEDCVSDTKDLLERRYPASTDGVNADEAKPLQDFCLPSAFFNALQRRRVSTSLDFGKQIRRTGPCLRRWLNE